MDHGLTAFGETVAAVVLAAGLSLRMGQPKMVLPWGEETVIGYVVSQVLAAGITEIWVVCGGSSNLVKEALQQKPVKFVFNPQFSDGEMLHSLQAGIRAISTRFGAAMVILGDQPQIKTSVISRVLTEYQQFQSRLVIPSYQLRRGHPWLIARDLWPEILQLSPPKTLRDFLSQNSQLIRYINLDEPSVLADLDTPEDYRRQRP